MTTHASSPGGVAEPIAPPRASIVRRIARFAVGIAVVCAVTYGATELYAFEQRPITLEGVAIPRTGDPEPLVRELAEAWYETEITLDGGSEIVRATRRELGG